MSHLRVGFIGLGYMGQGMATNILESGFELTVMAHRRRDAVDELTRQGAREAKDLAALAANADVIVLCVTGAEQVDDLLRRAGGIGAHAAPGTVVVDCTTSRPDTLLQLSRDFPELDFLDGPLGRSPKEAWQGKLSIMVGGDGGVLERARPVLEAFADTIQHVGPVGCGHALKLVNNIVSLGYAAIYSEAMAVTAKSGISIAAFDELISSSRMGCDFFQTFMGWVRSGDDTSHKFALGLAEHTITDAAIHAQKLGLNLPVLDAVRDTYVDAITQGMASENLPQLPRAVAIRNSLTIAPYKT